MISAPDLFIADGKPYLLVTSVGHVSPGLDPSGVDYRACLTIPIDDLASATVARAGGGGAPAVLRELRAGDGRFAGACTYAEGATAAGYLVPELYATAPAFRILRTAIAAP
jgi:hypothetical protein